MNYDFTAFINDINDSDADFIKSASEEYWMLPNLGRSLQKACLMNDEQFFEEAGNLIKEGMSKDLQYYAELNMLDIPEFKEPLADMTEKTAQFLPLLGAVGKGIKSLYNTGKAYAKAGKTRGSDVIDAAKKKKQRGSIMKNYGKIVDKQKKQIGEAWKGMSTGQQVATGAGIGAAGLYGAQKTFGGHPKYSALRFDPAGFTKTVKSMISNLKNIDPKDIAKKKEQIINLVESHRKDLGTLKGAGQDLIDTVKMFKPTKVVAEKPAVAGAGLAAAGLGGAGLGAVGISAMQRPKAPRPMYKAPRPMYQMPMYKSARVANLTPKQQILIEIVNLAQKFNTKGIKESAKEVKDLLSYIGVSRKAKEESKKLLTGSNVATAGLTGAGIGAAGTIATQGQSKYSLDTGKTIGLLTTAMRIGQHIDLGFIGRTGDKLAKTLNAIAKSKVDSANNKKLIASAVISAAGIGSAGAAATATGGVQKLLNQKKQASSVPAQHLILEALRLGQKFDLGSAARTSKDIIGALKSIVKSKIQSKHEKQLLTSAALASAGITGAIAGTTGMIAMNKAAASKARVFTLAAKGGGKSIKNLASKSRRPSEVRKSRAEALTWGKKLGLEGADLDAYVRFNAKRKLGPEVSNVRTKAMQQASRKEGKSLRRMGDELSSAAKARAAGMQAGLTGQSLQKHVRSEVDKAIAPLKERVQKKSIKATEKYQKSGRAPEVHTRDASVQTKTQEQLAQQLKKKHGKKIERFKKEQPDLYAAQQAKYRSSTPAYTEKQQTWSKNIDPAAPPAPPKPEVIKPTEVPKKKKMGLGTQALLGGGALFGATQFAGAPKYNPPPTY